MKRIICAGILMVIGACQAVMPNARNAGDQAGAGSSVHLRNLSYRDGVLEGEIVNQGDGTLDEVVIEISFLGDEGKIALRHDVRVVPGGDGRPLRANHAKHFRFEVEIDSETAVRVDGVIKSIQYRNQV